MTSGCGRFVQALRLFCAGRASTPRTILTVVKAPSQRPERGPPLRTTIFAADLASPPWAMEGVPTRMPNAEDDTAPVVAPDPGQVSRDRSQRVANAFRCVCEFAQRPGDPMNDDGSNDQNKYTARRHWHEPAPQPARRRLQRRYTAQPTSIRQLHRNMQFGGRVLVMKKLTAAALAIAILGAALPPESTLTQAAAQETAQSDKTTIRTASSLWPSR